MTNTDNGYRICSRNILRRTPRFNTTNADMRGHVQPPVQMVLGALPMGIKQMGHEADHPSPFSAIVKNAWTYTFTPPESS